MSDTQILVASNDSIVQIRIIGRATFTCSQDLRDFCLQVLDTDVSRIIIDLSDCATMDSTVLGILAMLGLRYRAKKRSIEIVNADKVRRGLLTALGLGKLFIFSETETDEVDWVSLCRTKGGTCSADNDLKQAKLILESHETLTRVTPENVPKFKDVIEFLKEDIKNLTNKKHK